MNFFFNCAGENFVVCFLVFQGSNRAKKDADRMAKGVDPIRLLL